MDARIIAAAAEIAHEANRVYCAATNDNSQVPWADAPEWQRESAIAGVTASLNGKSEEQLHDAWMAHKLAAGWKYGAVKDADAKTHPSLVAFDELPLVQKRKDTLFRACVHAALVVLDGVLPVVVEPVVETVVETVVEPVVETPSA